MDNHTSYTVMLAKIKAHRYTKEVIAEALKKYNVTVMEWLLLGAVDSNKGKVSSTELAQELQVSVPLISRFTKTLEDKQYIQVTTSTEDKRWRNITLTKKGQTMLAESEPVVREALKKWLAPIPREHVDVYIQVLLAVAYKL